MKFDYERQATANLLAFYTNNELEKKKNVLIRLIEEMNKEGVVFALSCSGAYFFRGIIDDFHDYDVVVEKESVGKFIDIFTHALGGQLTFGQNGKEDFFDSKVFCFGTLDGVEFDVICEFTVTTYNTRYCYSLKKEDVEFINNIPVCPVESSLILYGMMIQWQARRRFKYEAALEYLSEIGVTRPEILNTEQCLPKFIRDDIKSLLG